MKIFVYLEFYKTLGNKLYRKLGTGIYLSYKNQIEILKRLDIPYSTEWDDSCDIVQVNDMGPKSRYYIKKAHKSGKKVVLWSHRTIEDTEQIFRAMPFLIPSFRKYVKNHYRSADLVFTPSEYTRQIMISYGVSPEKIAARSNGIDLKKFKYDKETRLAGRTKFNFDKLTIGTMGLVIPRKGVETFLNTASKFPAQDFVWFGNIPGFFSSFWMKPLPKNLPANVRLAGYTADVLKAYNALDIFLFPSYEENEGIAIMEAAAVGLPILVRDIPVYQGWLEHGVNCLKAKTDAEFEKYLGQLIADKSLREKLGRNAQRMVQSKDLDAIAGQTLTAYQKLLGAKSA